jgi:hypothetical protein
MPGTVYSGPSDTSSLGRPERTREEIVRAFQRTVPRPCREQLSKPSLPLAGVLKSPVGFGPTFPEIPKLPLGRVIPDSETWLQLISYGRPVT